MKNKMLIGFIIVVVIVGAGAFYAGTLFRKTGVGDAINQGRIQREAGQWGGQAGQAGLQRGQGLRAGRGGGNMVNGEIIAKDDQSITVKLSGGLPAEPASPERERGEQAGSKIIFLSDTTQISKFTAGNLSDLVVGQSVIANGTYNTDGSITAEMIQLRPARIENAHSTGSGQATSTPGGKN